MQHPIAHSSSPPHILVVDDEPEVCAVLRSGFEAVGFAVSEAANRAGILQCLETTPIDLITLDILLGPEDGLQLAREVRALRNVPIVMITVKGDPADRVAGLELGADDYIVKPFRIREVLIRLRHVLHRYRLEAASKEPGTTVDAAEEHERYGFNGSVLDVRRRELRMENDMVALTEVEFELLAIFVRHPGRILSRDELTQMLKGRDWSPEDRTIDGHVARLRRKIDSHSEMPRLIKSVRGVGYVFTADVRRIEYA